MGAISQSASAQGSYAEITKAQFTGNNDATAIRGEAPSTVNLASYGYTADDFPGGGLSSDWTTSSYGGSSSSGVSGGILSLTATSAYYNAGTIPVGMTIEVRAKFTSDNFENIILSNDAFAGTPWVAIGRGLPGEPDGVYLRDNDGGSTDVLLGNFANSFHTYHISYIDATHFSVSVDAGAAVTRTIPTGMSGNVYFFLSDYISTNAMQVDWVKFSGGYFGDGTYTSLVYNTGLGSPTNWTIGSWDQVVPTGTTASVEVRANTGSAPTGAWTPISSLVPFSVTGDYFQYRVVMSSSDVFLTPYLSNFQFNVAGLPVGLSALTASAIGSDVKLEWSTASESNNKGFDVFRSTDGVKWNSIGFVAGAGNSSVTKKYSMTDPNLLSGKYYYKLRQSDFDGTSTFSNIVIANVNNKPTFGLSQNYPNPLRGATAITYSVPQSSHVRITVYDVNGRLVKVAVDAQRKAGTYTFMLDANTYNSGVYYYKMEADGYVATKKMVVQN